MKKVITFCFLFAFGTTFSQVITPSESSQTSSQPKVIVFKPDCSENSDENKTPEFNHMIKISPLMFFNGDLPVFYELRTGKNISVEIGLGLTNRDYIHEIYDQINDNYDNYGYEENTEHQMGKSLRLAFKYWPSKYGALDEGYYFSPEFLYRNYKSTSVVESYDYDLNESEITSYNQDRTIKEFRMIVGWVYYLDDNVFFEYFVGVGMASIKNRYYSENASIPFLEENKSRPNYIVGAKIGFSL